jgi:hypothetical protein
VIEPAGPVARSNAGLRVIVSEVDAHVPPVPVTVYVTGVVSVEITVVPDVVLSPVAGDHVHVGNAPAFWSSRLKLCPEQD